MTCAEGLPTANALAQRLRQEKTRRVRLERLWQLLRAVAPEALDAPDRRARLDAALTTLAGDGVLTLPGRAASNWDHLGVPALPQFISVVAEPTPCVEDAAADDWVPALQVLGTTRNPRRREDLRRINAFLVAHPEPFSVLVPYRERALEIFGDEKHFDGKVKDGCLYGELPLGVIGAMVPMGPLVSTRFATARPGNPVLLVENQHTYASVVEWNQRAQTFSAVAFGSGRAVQQSVPVLQQLVDEAQACAVVYFGDLDPTGVAIAAALSEAYHAATGSKTCPWFEAYGWLLERAQPRPLKEGKRLDADTRWLGVLATPAQAMFRRGEWIPQEALSLNVLLSDPTFAVGQHPR